MGDSWEAIDVNFTTIRGNSYRFSPGQTREKSVAYLSKADSDTLAKSTVAGLNG